MRRMALVNVVFLASLGLGRALPDAASPLDKVRDMLAELSKELPTAQTADEHQLQEFMQRSNKTLSEVSASLKEQRELAASLKASLAKAEARKKELEAEQKRAAAALLEVQTTFSVAKLENERQSGSRQKRLQSLHEDAKAVSFALDGVRPHTRKGADMDSLLQSARTFERVVDEDRDPRGAATDFAAARDFSLRKAAEKLRAALALGAPLKPAQQRLLQVLPGPRAPSFLQLRGHRSAEDPMEPLADTLAQVKRETATEIKSTEESQKKAQQTFAEVSKVLNEQIEARKKAVQQVDVQIHELEEEASKDQVELRLAERKAQVSAASAADITALQKQRGAEFQARSGTRKKEAEALKEATRILSDQKKPGLMQEEAAAPSFLQFDHAGRVHRGLRVEASAALIGGDAGTGSQLEAVKRMVEDLLRELREMQAQDTRRDDWCGSELNTTSTRIHEKAAALEEFQTRQTVATSEHESVVADLRRLQASLQALRDAAVEAKDRRQQDKAKALADQTSYEESRRMVHQAVTVLKKVYTGPTEGKGVVSLLEFSAQNYADLVDETRKAEEDAAFQFKRAAETREVQVAEYEADAKHKRQRSEQLAIQLKSMKQELGDSQVQLTALKKYLKKVQSECLVQPEDFASRKAKRDEEIKLLKDAQEILQENNG